MSATVMETSRHSPGVAVDCDLIAAETTTVPAAAIPSLREPLLAAFPNRLSNALLKQADEQSLVALTAFRDLLARNPSLLSESISWGLVAAPRVPGRRRMVESLTKFREQGAWSVSPHIIPHCTLHSLAGLLSQVLDQHGPNMGAGGKPGCEGEAFAVAAAWLAGERLRGVWIMLTGWDRETPTHSGAACQAVLLGLTPAEADKRGLYPRLTIAPAAQPGGAAEEFRLESLRSALESSVPGAWRLGATGTLGLWPAALVTEVAA